MTYTSCRPTQSDAFCYVSSNMSNCVIHLKDFVVINSISLSAQAVFPVHSQTVH